MKRYGTSKIYYSSTLHDMQVELMRRYGDSVEPGKGGCPIDLRYGHAVRGIAGREVMTLASSNIHDIN